jgi:hypothetical protein
VIGSKQATTLLQLSAGYVIATTKDPYKTLRLKGLVENTGTYERGGVVYEGGRVVPRITFDGRRALREYVDKNGRLELELQQPLADFVTVIRMDPVAEENER